MRPGSKRPVEQGRWHPLLSWRRPVLREVARGRGERITPGAQAGESAAVAIGERGHTAERGGGVVEVNLRVGQGSREEGRGGEESEAIL